MNDIKLKWVIIEREYKRWNSWDDCWEKSFYKDPPVLKYSFDGEKWIDVPTVIEKAEKL